MLSEIGVGAVYPLRESSIQSVVSDTRELIHMTMKLLKVDGVCYLGSICVALNQIRPIHVDYEEDWLWKPFLQYYDPPKTVNNVW